MTDILDLENLLHPISEAHPTGTDIRLSESAQKFYLSLREARQTARSIERQRMQNITLAVHPDWETVFIQAENILTEHTKDLEIAAWLCEALLRLYGFKGFFEGFRVIKKYIEIYWENIYPLPDEEGLSTRIAPLTGLNGDDTEGTLIIPLGNVFITEGKTLGPFSLWQYQQAVEFLNISSEKREQRIAAGAPSLYMIETAAEETSSEFFESLQYYLESSIILFEELENLLAEKCGGEAPPTSRIRNKLKESLYAVNYMSGKYQKFNTTENKTTTDYKKNNNKNIITKREEILENILKSAEFFRQTEPHSPLPYILERAVKWGKMSFPDIWRQLVQDETAWKHLSYLTGLELHKPDKPGE